MNDHLSRTDNDMAENSATDELAGAFGPDLGAQLYLNSSLQQRLDLIEHLIEFGRQIIILNGGPATGKSSILGHFATGQRLNWYPIRVQAGPALTGAGLATAIARELNVDLDTADELGPRIKQRLTALERAGKIPVLLVDDADRLPPDALPALLHFANTPDQHAELRVLMAADLDKSALREALQREHPQHGLVHVVEIPRLTEANARALITHRLQLTGIAADDHFTDADYAAIARTADGASGKVITLARQHLVGRHLAPKSRAARRFGTKAFGWPHKIAVGVVAAASVLFGAWWATRHPPAPPTSEVETVELPTQEASVPTPVAPPEILENDPALSAAPPSVSEPEVAPPAVEPPQAPPTASLPPGIVEPAGELSDPTLAPLPEPAGIPVAPEVPPQPVVPAITEAVVPAIPPKPVETPQPKPEPPPPAPKLPPQPKAAVASAKTPIGAATPPVAAPIREFSAEWLLKQPVSGHTLQLFGVRERAGAERFIRERGIAQQSVILRTTMQGKPWFVVAYGYYPTRSAALAVVAKRPHALRDTKPWARSIGSLRAAR
jgi:DamX protein